MKRVGYLMERIADMENLREAFFAAARGKSVRRDVAEYRANLGEGLDALRQGLLAGDPEVGGYRQFTIHDPKERVITVAPFGQRVLHHALMRVCEPVFDAHLIPRTYACRKGKGRLVALEEAQRQCGRHAWYLKLDIRRYFDSVPHARLIERLWCIFKDPRLLRVFERIIRSFEVRPGCGLPIGNLTSQHFANLYLDRVDRHIEAQRCEDGGRFVVLRYMDDLLVFGRTYEALAGLRKVLRAEVVPSLGLSLKQERIGRTSDGVGFLGCVVWRSHRELNRRSRIRFTEMIERMDRGVAEGWLSEEEAQRRGTAMVAYARTASSLRFRQGCLEGHFWASALGETGPGTGGFAGVVGTTTRTTRRSRIATTTTTRPTATTTTGSVSPAARDPSLDGDECPEPAVVQRCLVAGETRGEPSPVSNAVEAVVESGDGGGGLGDVLNRTGKGAKP